MTVDVINHFCAAEHILDLLGDVCPNKCVSGDD